VVLPQNNLDSFSSVWASKPIAAVCEWFSLKTAQTIFAGLASKPVVTVSGGLASKPTATVSSGLASKPAATVSRGLASKPVALDLVSRNSSAEADSHPRHSDIFDLPLKAFLFAAVLYWYSSFQVFPLVCSCSLLLPARHAMVHLRLGQGSIQRFVQPISSCAEFFCRRQRSVFAAHDFL
jgi:hypothetical protein